MEVLRFGIKQLLQFSQDIFVHLYSLVVVMTVNFHLICADTLPAEKGGHMKPAASDAARQQVESTGFSAIFKKLIITVGAQLYAYKTIVREHCQPQIHDKFRRECPGKVSTEQEHLSLKLSQLISYFLC